VSTPPNDPPPAGGPSEPARPEGRPEEHHGEPRCPRCGAPHDPLQEYCLECGLRLVPLPSQRYTRTTVWSRESPFWLWAALGTLLLLALAAGAIVALAATDEEDPGASPGVASVATTGGTTTIPPPPTADTLTSQTTITIPSPTGTSTTTPTLPTTTTQPTTSTQATTTNGDDIIDWPAGTDGYSVFLRSTPTSEGRGPADSAARQAIDDGLPQVGVLNSSEFDSLNPGYYVTFTGVHTSKSQAEEALPTARSKGFPTAYVRPVAD
jgi:hypothetical protein